MKLCGVAAIAIFSHDLRVYVFWIIVYFFIVECSAVSSVNDDDKQAYESSFSVVAMTRRCSRAFLLYFCNGYK